MYFDQASESRTWAPRIGTRLCIVCVQFSARHSQRRSGKWKCISAGASDCGVFWKTMRIPSTTISWPVVVIEWVGAISPIGPRSGMPLPSPQSTWPRGPGGRVTPNW